jgi:hypothetical protein
MTKSWDPVARQPTYFDCWKHLAGSSLTVLEGSYRCVLAVRLKTHARTHAQRLAAASGDLPGRLLPRHPRRPNPLPLANRPCRHSKATAIRPTRPSAFRSRLPTSTAATSRTDGSRCCRLTRTASMAIRMVSATRADRDVESETGAEMVVAWWWFVLMPALGFLTGLVLRRLWPEFSPFRIPPEQRSKDSTYSDASSP